MQAHDDELLDAKRDAIALFRALLAGDHVGSRTIIECTGCKGCLALQAALLGVILSADGVEVDDAGIVTGDDPELDAEAGGHARPPERHRDEVVMTAGEQLALEYTEAASVSTRSYIWPEAERQASRELHDRYQAELEQVQSWTWERLAYPRGESQARRQRHVVTVKRHPSGWLDHAYPRQPTRCRTYSGDWEKRLAYHEFHGENHELHPAIWHVHVEIKGSRKPSREGGWWCDAHLPDEYRPDGPHEDAPPPAPREKRAPEPSYFAVWGHYDRTGLTKFHFWYRVRIGRQAGKIQPWPPTRSRFGTLFARDIPSEQECRDTFSCSVREWRERYWQDVRDVRDAALREIDEHPEDAAAMFAAFHSYCCCCGKGLTDERSKVYGIGPECRRGLAPEVLKRIGDKTARLYRDQRASGQAP